MSEIKPIVKWAGGKTQLLDKIKERMPKKYGSYYEPFIGGAALLLNVQPKKAHINDINSELINTYTQIRDDAPSVKTLLKYLDDNHTGEEYYYKKRDEFNTKIKNKEYDSYMAALFIYLNKHCFNGLYRVNSRGFFNVPYNNKDRGRSYDEENINSLSEYLKKVKIVNGDFESSVKKAKKGDFVFFDSPYAPLNPTSFESYTKEGFSIEDHERLAYLFKELDKKGVYCMLTNHNTKLIKKLYKGYNIDVVQVHRNINSKGNSRKGEEVIITNYQYATN